MEKETLMKGISVGIITLFMSEDSARKFREMLSNPMFGFIGLMLAWQVFVPIFRFIFLIAVNLLYPGTHYR